jgi:uncharacterized protein
MIELETPHGPARARVLAAAGSGAEGLALVLGHGAGGGIDAPDLAAASEAAVALGVSVALVEQPYRVAGRRSPAPAAQLDAAWLAVVAGLRDGVLAGCSLVTGGRSSGARVACRTSSAAGAVGVLCLAFPLHPPGRADDPSKSRLGELDSVSVPVLVVQGERDPFGMPPARRGRGARGARRIVTVAGTHSLRARGPVRDAVATWLREVATAL